MNSNLIQMISNSIQVNWNLIQMNPNLIQVHSYLITVHSYFIQVNSCLIQVNSYLIQVSSNLFQDIYKLSKGYHYNFLRIKYLHMVSIKGLYWFQAKFFLFTVWFVWNFAFICKNNF